MHTTRRRLLAAFGLQAAGIGNGSHLKAMIGAKNACRHYDDKSCCETPFSSRRGARRWYVDNSLSANGDGTAWVSAWNAFARINWTSIVPGDTVYISGGISGQTYNETLVVRTSGASGAPVTITAGSDLGHAGPVIIDAQGVRSECVVVGSHSHLIIQNLTVRNNADNANLTIDGATAGVIIHNIISHSGMGLGGGNDCRCFDIRNCVAIDATYAVVLQHCIATTPASTTSQTDALWTSGNDGVLIRHNLFTISNTDPTGHSDCIQSYNDASVTFVGNFLCHPDGGTNNHGFIVSDVQAGGVLYFFNNVIIMGSTPNWAVGKPEIAIFREYLTSGYTGTVKIWNNTIYGGLAGYYLYATAGTMPADEFKNNIIYSLPVSTAPYYLGSGKLTMPTNIDYNDVFVSNDNLVVHNRGSSVGAVRSTTAKTSGLVYFEIQLGMAVHSDNTLVGIGNAAATLTRYIGATGDSIGWKWNDGSIYCNNSRNNVIGVTAIAYDVIAFTFNFNERKFWVKNLTQESGWNGNIIANQDPAMNIGGYPLLTPAAGPYYIMISVGDAGDSIILNTGGAPFVGIVPSGFSAWGAPTTLNPTDIAAPATLVAPIAYINGSGFQNWATWRALGYDEHGVNTNPLFVNAGGRNFQLQSTSPAIKAGVMLPAVTTDYAGIARPRASTYDIGAYQFWPRLGLPRPAAQSNDVSTSLESRPSFER